MDVSGSAPTAETTRTQQATYEEFVNIYNTPGIPDHHFSPEIDKHVECYAWTISPVRKYSTPQRSSF